MRLALALFILIPIIEIAVFIQAGNLFGLGLTLLMILLTAVIGLALIRQQGLATLFRAQEKMQSGEVPAVEMMEGILLAAAGLLLITPGFFTDTIGFLILVPIIRTAVILRVIKFQPMVYQQPQSKPTSGVIEGEFERKNDD
ncbi:MAG: FxsA family protein [Gammaproteobacteria bacterium]|nr:FxsA family protein [Gammaproteobacteria bacterium]NNJ72236.1 FxsA family protein [Enterobacterales bacterium]